MKKKLFLVVALVFALMLFAGAAWAKTGGETGQGKGKGAGLQNAQNFSDVNEHWAKLTIKKMNAKGLFKGYEDDTFRPNNPLTEAEAIVLADRIASKFKPQQEVDSEPEEVDDEDGDLEGVPGWAEKSVQKAVYNGVIKRFHSETQFSRAEACIVLAKDLQLEPVAIDPGQNPFKDMNLFSDEDYGYILALYNKGYIKGTPNGNFNPNSHITRAEMATIMDRIDSDLEDDSKIDNDNDDNDDNDDKDDSDIDNIDEDDVENDNDD